MSFEIALLVNLDLFTYLWIFLAWKWRLYLVNSLLSSEILKFLVPWITEAILIGFRESQTALLRPVSSEPGEKPYSDFDKTDTQSSLASFGRMTGDYRRELSVPPSEESTRQSSPIVHGKEVEEDIFHPSSDDNFFKISNPVSERLADFDSEINISGQERVHIHKSWDNHRQTYFNGVQTSDRYGSEEQDEHIYETVTVQKTSELSDKSESQSNSVVSWLRYC